MNKEQREAADTRILEEHCARLNGRLWTLSNTSALDAIVG
jgi:hypothetical protein